MNLGKAIKELRKQKRYSQRALGDAVGMTQAAMSAIEKGAATPQPRNLEAIAKVLQIPVAAIYLYAIDENDVAVQKKELYKVLFPAIQDLLKRLI